VKTKPPARSLRGSQSWGLGKASARAAMTPGRGGRGTQSGTAREKDRRQRIPNGRSACSFQAPTFWACWRLVPARQQFPTHTAPSHDSRPTVGAPCHDRYVALFVPAIRCLLRPRVRVQGYLQDTYSEDWAEPYLISYCNDGVPGRTRTCDPQFRKLLLYPPELRGRRLKA
jgi:hypothetical protein